jgi:murein L,D-transpeptidase YafK
MKQISFKHSSQIKQRLALLLIFGVCGTTLYFLLARFSLSMNLSEASSVLCLPTCESIPSFHPPLNGEQRLNDKQPLSKLLGKNPSPAKVSLLIEKAKYRLTVFYDRQPIKSYPVVFGRNPSGNKLHEGDQKTPEGIFHIQDRYEHPNWSKFIWIDYPTAQSWQNHFRAKSSGEIDELLPIGGQVGIHGVPAGKDALIEQRSNWTLGCISLKNTDVNEIYPFIKIGSLIEIVP